MYTAIIVIALFVCVLLALVVLAQNSKGGGLAGGFSAGGTAQLMGVKRTGDLLERLTWGFAIALMVLALGSHVVLSNSGNGPVRSVNQQKAMEARLPAAPVAPGPGAAAPGGAAAPAQSGATAPAAAPAAQPAAPAATPAQ
ncbi:preprotein translocase subunit SecG [Hymenobacter sp. 15J16-1T3B]|uniref:preprotein translocase subunit SecG n=1 Tax=Hymenobacter sp. 15J16-1T3B TaxID=2886941 RepID=UPI001D102CD1|nr:preprotein translocase subunit SecG [Hymenobacter sp. 15J16-1T3B]MCC3158899.1 preprotein translocase subunit SecG [Hymenobacter sp. 15J16-1T3B]